MFALRSDRSFEETLLAIVMEGGDADTNGAPAGSHFSRTLFT